MCDLARSALMTVAILFGVSNIAGTLEYVRHAVDGDLSHDPSSSTGGLVQRRRPCIVLFGDSLTQRSFGEDGNVGWGSLLSAAYIRRADVKERGFGGYNTHHALHVWPEIEEAYQDEMLFGTLFFGANDAVLPGHPQHIPVEEYGHNLEELILNIRQIQPTVPLILFTPPPVDEIAREGANYPRQNEITKSYGDVVKEVGRRHQLAVLDTWELLEGHNHTAYSQYLSDGLHFNELGNRKIYEGLMDLIHKEYPNLEPKTDNHTEGLPFLHKKWQEYE